MNGTKNVLVAQSIERGPPKAKVVCSIHTKHSKDY